MNTFVIAKRVLFIILFSIQFLLVFGNNTPVNFINKDSFKDVQQEAENQNKPIFVDFHAAWCAPCKKVDKEVFHNSEVGAFMNENFINYKVNIEKGNGPMVALIYEIEVLPSVVIVQPNGEIILKKSAYMGSDSFLNWAKEGSHKFTSINIDIDINVNDKIQDLYKNNLKTNLNLNLPSEYPTLVQYIHFNVGIIERRNSLLGFSRISGGLDSGQI